MMVDLQMWCANGLAVTCPLTWHKYLKYVHLYGECVSVIQSGFCISIYALTFGC